MRGVKSDRRSSIFFCVTSVKEPHNYFSAIYNEPHSDNRLPEIDQGVTFCMTNRLFIGYF